MDGFGIGFGTIIPGSGFALRPRYTRTDLLGGRLTLRIDALGSINQSYMGGLDLAMPNLFSGHAFIEFSVVNRDISEAFREVRAILAAERRKRDRQVGLTEFVRGLQAKL